MLQPAHADLFKLALMQTVKVLSDHWLAAFSHAVPINNSLLGAYATEREALTACQDRQPDFLYITEQLEQGYGINLALKVKNISPATRVLLFSHRESQDVVREAIEANVDGIIFVHSIGQSDDGDFFKVDSSDCEWIKLLSERGKNHGWVCKKYRTCRIVRP